MWEKGEVNLWYAFLAFNGALLSHVSVNAFNEYLDFKSGLDARTTKTPFSGGSGTLVDHPELETYTFWFACLSLLVTVAIGIYFFAVWGWAIVPLGMVGLLLVVSYTGFITRHPLLCLIAPGLGFGTLWVVGTHFVLTGRYSPTAFTASLVPFFLVSDLLLLNQFPDAEADKTVGRKHLPIVKGKSYSARIYSLFLGLAYLCVVVGTLVKTLPRGALAGLLTLPLALHTARKVLRDHDDMELLAPALKWNVLINLLTPALVGTGMLLQLLVASGG